MQIEVTRSNGYSISFNGNIEYHDTYIVIKYRIFDDNDKFVEWAEIAIPWRLINEVEVKP